MKMANWVKVGTVRSKKAPKVGTHILVEQDIKLAKGSYLQVFDPRARKNKDGSGLTEQQLEKIPPYIKYEIFLVDDSSSS